MFALSRAWDAPGFTESPTALEKSLNLLRISCNINVWLYLEKNIEDQEINPWTYGQLIFNKGAKNIKCEKDSLLSKSCWENWTATCKSVKLEHIFTAYTKIHWKLEKEHSGKYDKTL